MNKRPHSPPVASPPRSSAGPAPVPGSGSSVPSPPLALTGAHFGAALAFFAAGTAGLSLSAAELARGNFLAPRLEASVHLITLGWITFSILGALYQFLPVALERAVASTRAAWATFALHLPGLAGFATWMWTGWDALLLPSAFAMGTGLLVFVVNLFTTLARSRVRDVTWWALILAGTYLAATVAMGVTLALNLRYDLLGGSRVPVMAAHLHLALAGWVMLVLVGVGNRLLPMFLLSRPAPRWPAALSVVLLGAGCLVLALLHHAIPMEAWPLAALLLVGGGVSWIGHAAGFFRHRVPRKLDAGLRGAAGGLVLLGGGILAGAPLAFGWADTRYMTVQATALVLGFVLVVAGHHFKIVPFLVWYHRYAVRPGRGGVQRVAELYSPRVAGTAVTAQAAGAFLFLAGIAARRPGLATAGAALLAAGAWLQSGQLLTLLLRRPSP